MPIVHFLLVYDRKLQELVFERQFAHSGEAVAEYERMEDLHKGDRDKEIVLIGADSLDTIKLTHANYFKTVPSQSPYLAGV